jgi:tetratricopeptide (TPR) repeat protein
MPMKDTVLAKQALTVLVLLCTSNPGIAQDVQVEAITPADDPLPTTQLSVDSRDEILAQIQTQLDLLESSRDAYDIGISELSLELGAHYAELGYYDQSLEAYRRALHIARINYGLTSEQQLPILEQFLELYEEAGYLEEIDTLFNKMLLIYGENHDAWSPEMANLYELIGSWHLAAYYHQIDENPVSHLVSANIALSNAHKIGMAQSDNSYNFNLYNLLSLTNWELSTFYIDNTKSDLSNENVMYSRQTSAHIMNSFRGGREMLLEGIEAAEKSGNTENIVRATLMFADWNQMFNRVQTALDNYIKAYNQVDKLPQDNSLRLSFNTPHALPNFDQSEFSVELGRRENYEIELSFDVTQWGRPSNITLVEEPAEAEAETEEDLANEETNEAPAAVISEEEQRQKNDAVRQAMSTIRNTVFRPAFADGQPTDYQNVRQVILVAKES